MPHPGSTYFFGRFARLAASVLAFSAFATATVCAEPVPPADDAIPAIEVSHARDMATNGDAKGAIRALEPYVASHPHDLDAGRYLGDLFLVAADPARAERAYLAILNVAPSDPQTHARLGDLYSSQDRLLEAIAQYQRTLPDVAAFSDLVRVHKRMGDLAEFVESYRQAAEDPTDVAAQFAYGVVLQEIHRSAEAVVYLRKAVANNPHSCAALTELGVALTDTDQPERGMDSFRACLTIDPDDYAALVDAASAEPLDRQAEARALLEHAIAVHAQSPEAFVDLGYLDDTIGNHESAVVHYEHAIALDPFCRAAYVNLGYDEVQGGLFALAETTLLRGLSISNGDGRLEFLLAKMFEHQGKVALAKREYQNATRSDEPDIAAAATLELRHTQ
jgi:tetratricopeptide (TPR) repeat protein